MRPAIIARAPRQHDPALTAAALACGLAAMGVLLPTEREWLRSWRGLLDVYLSLVVVLFIPIAVVLHALRGFVGRGGEPAGQADRAGESMVVAPDTVEGAVAPLRPTARRSALWAAVLLLVCVVELLAHSGPRNGFLASSRPENGIEQWTTADGYSVLLDGIPAQGDGLFLLPMLRLFAGEAPPAPGDFDRRAGHVYLVSLAEPLLGTYWGFAAVNLAAWWAAALAVWWLGGRRWSRWPGTPVAEVASLLVATGQGFIFMGAAPQAHAAAYGGYALVLAAGDALRLWRPGARLRDWVGVGWAAGVGGLFYLVHLPSLLFLWVYGLASLQGASGAARVRRVAGLLAATAATLAIVYGWQIYGGALLGLRFEGGNNDLTGEAVAGWLRVGRAGVVAAVDQLHAGSVRGLMGAAFYYPWWLLAVVGFAASGRDARRWSLAVFAAGAIPAIAFTTRFHLPRLMYFVYPAVYLLAAQGIAVVAEGAARARSGPAARRARFRTPWVRAVAAGALIVLLVALPNVDLAGLQQLNLWFHYSQGNAW